MVTNGNKVVTNDFPFIFQIYFVNVIHIYKCKCDSKINEYTYIKMVSGNRNIKIA